MPYGKLTRKVRIGDKNPVWNSGPGSSNAKFEILSSQLSYELYILYHVYSLRVFIIISINYIIGVYANTRTQMAKCLMIVSVNESPTSIAAKTRLPSRLRMQIRLLPLSQLSLIQISAKLSELTRITRWTANKSAKKLSLSCNSIGNLRRIIELAESHSATYANNCNL